MKPPRFSLVIPTISRPTLVRCLLSLRGQDWQPGDEILLVGDGPQEAAAAFWNQLDLPGRYIETPTKLGHWGHGIRNWVNEQRLARGSHLLNLDDDDAYTPGAIAAIRAKVRQEPDAPHIFRMRDTTDGMLRWKVREAVHGNVGTPMIVVPNDRAKLGTWASRYGGDGDSIREALEHYKSGPVFWHEEVICDVWPAKDIPR
jgi:glycosyltransferase involved in cell wall biosynthesis